MTIISNQQLKRSMQKWFVRAERARWVYGKLGRSDSDSSAKSSQQDHMWVRMDAGTLDEVYNAGGVDDRVGLPVRMRDDGGRLIIEGINTSGLLIGDTNAPSKVYSVNDILPDGSGNVTLDTDDIPEGSTNQYYTAERARDDIGTALTPGTAIGITVSDPGDTITIAVNDAELLALAGLTSAADRLPYFTGSATAALATFTNYARTLLDDANIAAAQATLALVPGTNVQAFDATLLSIAALGTAADRMLYTTGVDTWAELTTTSYGRAFLALANAAALATVMATSAHGATLDTTPLDADEVPGLKSTTSFSLVRWTWTSIKAFLKTYFDTLYNLYVHPNHTGDVTSVGDGATTIAANAVTDTKLRDSALLSVIGRSANSAGDPADIAAVAASGAVLRESGGVLGFGTVTTAGLSNNAVTSAKIATSAVTNAKLADMANPTVKGRTTAGTGAPEDLTMAQLVALIEVQALYALLAGRSGGQTLNGGTGSGENLTLSSTAHATKGKIFLGAAQTSAYDGVNNRLSIGATDPIGEIEAISTATANAQRGISSTQINTGAQAAVFNFMKARGSRASKTTVANGDFIGDLVFLPHDGTNYLRTAQIAARANGTVATASVPTDIIFAAGDVDDPNLTNERMRIKSTGEVETLGLLIVDGFIVNPGGIKIQSADVTKNNNTTFADLTGLSVTVVAGKTYIVHAVLYVTVTTAGGAKFQFAGTSTVTSGIDEIYAIDNTNNAIVFAIKQTPKTLGGFQGAGPGLDWTVYIDATIVVNAGGTLTIQFAQQTANASNCTVKAQSIMEVRQVAA